VVPPEAVRPSPVMVAAASQEAGGYRHHQDPEDAHRGQAVPTIDQAI